MRPIHAALLLALLLPACRTAEKAIHATAPKEGEQGIGVNTDVDTTFGVKAKFNLNNVGGYDSMPPNWTGPIPPGWTANNVEIARAEAEKAKAEAAKAAAELEALKLKAQLAPPPGEGPGDQ